MSEMPARELMISRFSDTLGVQPIRVADGEARCCCRWPSTCAIAATSCTAARSSR